MWPRDWSPDVCSSDLIITSPHPYRRFIATFALGLMAAGVVGMLGGGWLIAAVSAATTMLIDRVQRFLRHRNLRSEERRVGKWGWWRWVGALCGEVRGD